MSTLMGIPSEGASMTGRSDHFQAGVFSQMEAMDHDYPTPAYTANKDKPLYHGTTANIPDVVQPANAVDQHVSEYSMGDPGDMSEGDHAFATHDEHYAWRAAQTFHRNGRRPRVYEVNPAPDMKPGPWNKDHPDFLYHHELDDPDDYDVVPGSDDEQMHEMTKELAEKARTNLHQPEYGSPTGFPVRKRIDIMPGHQGTFPQVNWNRYKDPVKYGGPSYGVDANHPNDEHVEHGLAGKPKEAPAPPPQAPSFKEYMSAKEGTYSPPDRSQRHQLKLF